MNILIDQRKGEKYNKDIIKQAVDFFAKKILSYEQILEINSIKVILCNNFRNLGECYKKDKETDGKSDFILRINREIPFPDIISTVAHEMVHLHQFISKQLISTDDNWIWKNKKYDNDIYKMHKATEESQKHIPWEKVAYAKEAKLAKQFFNHYFNSITSA